MKGYSSLNEVANQEVPRYFKAIESYCKKEAVYAAYKKANEYVKETPTLEGTGDVSQLLYNEISKQTGTGAFTVTQTFVSIGCIVAVVFF